MRDVDISIQDISKVEGHASLDVKVRDGRVDYVRLKFTENKRFFTQAIRDKNIHNVAQSVARICGTCSIAHILCCIEALEHALTVEPSEQTELLKKLTMHGLMIRDHALHLYIFSLPDVFKKDSVLDFNEKESVFLHDSFAVKRAGNRLSTVVAGRAVHAPFPTVGGFAKVPTNEELRGCIKDLKEAREKLFKVLDVYKNCKFEYKRKTNFISLVGDRFDFLDGNICSTTGLCISEAQYLDHLHKVVIPYSQSVGYKCETDPYMVGALARINLNKEGLHKDTKKDAAEYLKMFPSNNVFHNNLAQGLEILHSIDQSIEIIESNDFKPESPPDVTAKESTGVGVIEAPRGTLYYKLLVKKDGSIKDGTIIVPTQQNQINMECDIMSLVQQSIKKLSKQQIELEIEKLIRAYDPCISCASHFLRVHWE